MVRNKVETKSWLSKTRLAVAGFLIIAAGVAYASSAQASGCQYEVQSGDTLSKIALNLGLQSWQTLYNANKEIIGGNPNLIHSGQRLDICFGTGGPTEKDLKLEPAVKIATAKTFAPKPPIILPAPTPELCQYTNSPDGSPKLRINGGGECNWPWTTAIGNGPFSVWPTDPLADGSIANATNTGCPSGYRDGSRWCWDGGKITGGAVRIRSTGQVTTIEAAGGQQIPVRGGDKDCYGENLPGGAWIWWCAPK